MNSLDKFEIELPVYDFPPKWIPLNERQYHPDYGQSLEQYLPRNIILRRLRTSDALGFNIIGGKEYSSGIYISKVMPNTDAEKLGLKEGDQILTLNGSTFSDFQHSNAVQILKCSTEIQMQVRYFPYGYNKACEALNSSY